MQRVARWTVLLTPTLALAQQAPPAPKDRPGEVMPDRHWDFRHLDLDVTIDPDARRVSGTATHTVAALGQRSSHLRLHEMGLQIEEVRVDGEVVERWRVGTETLDVPIPAGDGEHVVSVRFATHPELGLHFRDPRGSSDPIVEVWSQGEDEDNRFWYPGWDYPNDRFTVTTHLTVPSSLHAVAVGAFVGKEPAQDGWTRWTYSLDQEIPNYLVAIAAGEYAVYAQPGPVPMEFVVPRSVSEQEAKAALAIAGDQLEWFTKRFDEPFPYPVYRQVIVQRFLYGGMENASLTIIGDKYFHTTDGVRGRPTENVVAHELAHQWFGDLVTCYGWREMWLNEGFATYWAARWQEDRHGAEFAAVKIRERQRAARAVKVPMAARSWSRVGEQENGGNYTRGASVLQMLRVLLGEAVFEQAIRTYLEEHRGRFAESEDLRRTLEDTSGTHLGWLFDQYVYTGGNPSLSSKWSWEEGTLTVEVTQATDGTPYTVPVDVEIGTGRTQSAHRVWVDDGVTRLTVDMAEPPLWVAMDSTGMLIADWDQQQPTAAWLAQLELSRSAFARHDAVEALAKAEATEEVVEALRTKLEDQAVDPDFRYRVAAALGALGSPSAVSVLVAATGDVSPRVREGAVDALGQVQSTPYSLERLIALQTEDSDPVVRASALQALDSIDPKKSLHTARRVLTTPDRSHRAIEHDVAVRILERRGDDTDLRRLFDKLDPRVRSYTRLTAAHSAGALFQRLEPGDQEKLRDRATLVGKLLLTDPDFRIRTAGITLLGAVGGAEAERRLESYAAETTVSWQKERARDAASSIRSGQSAPAHEDAGDEDTDIERLEEEVEELQKRVERLEEWR